MTRKNRGVDKEKIPVIATALKEKAKIPRTMSLEQTVRELAKPIQEMLDAGYSYDDVAALFADHGVLIASGSIKSYHRKQKPFAAKAADTAPDSQPSSHVDDSPSDAEVFSDTNLEPKPEPKSKQGRASTGEKKTEFNVTNRDEL